MEESALAILARLSGAVAPWVLSKSLMLIGPVNVPVRSLTGDDISLENKARERHENHETRTNKL